MVSSVKVHIRHIVVDLYEPWCDLPHIHPVFGGKPEDLERETTKNTVLHRTGMIKQ
jgi:hypothetical protein